MRCRPRHCRLLPLKRAKCGCMCVRASEEEGTRVQVTAEASENESDSDRKNGPHRSSATHWFAMRASLESRVAMVCRVSAVRYALMAFSRGADRSPGTGSPYLPRRGGWWDKHKRLAFSSKQPQGQVQTHMCVRVRASASPVKLEGGRRRLPLELHTYRTRIRSNRTRRACSVPEASPMRWICTDQHTITRAHGHLRGIGGRACVTPGSWSQQAHARTKVSAGTEWCAASSRTRTRLQATPHITPTCSLRSSASPSSSLSE
jgi:hypothetical protein